jgi:hypothetical protein
MLVGVGSEFEMADRTVVDRPADVELTVQLIANRL